jgi:hypothetical protein
MVEEHEVLVVFKGLASGGRYEAGILDIEQLIFG